MSKYSKKNIEKLIFDDALSYEAIGRIYGVTGSAIKKAAKKLGINLPQRRTINERESFSRSTYKSSLIDKLSDEELLEILKSNIGWKNISLALGYSNTISSNVKNKLLERCSTLGMEPQIQAISPILLQTKGELLSKRKNYQSYRSAIRKLAEKIYKNSNKELKCAVCNYDKHVEIAHIKPVSDFDDCSTIAEINSIDNLIALCPNHHWEYDNGILKI